MKELTFLAVGFGLGVLWYRAKIQVRDAEAKKASFCNYKPT